MKISEHQFLLLGRELDRLLERVAQRIRDLNTLYFMDSNKLTAKGRAIEFELKRAKEYYGERDPRLWDSLYYLTKNGIRFKSFLLPRDFVPLKEQMKDLNEKNVPMKINR
ncbi:hypothetical protein J0A67_04530 [Algoriphagus aestuariicola]|uniref:Uncharacterized protein n=1 Tax=Algoriphagus aestuariicola TaxID=1852016 RepID=A0ABS3BLC9_9BACT|nr:hypothetical protein [Algoriphagus aestuariicola]MBN7800113.1 hypothetical protein [Algoriphagus aestuariicola]